MKYALDTEFLEDGRSLTLLSLGLAAEDGREYYAEVADVECARANAWVRANVLVHLGKSPQAIKSRAQTSARRIQAAPELPTVAEAALPAFAPTDRRLSAVEFFRFCQSCYAAADARSRVDDPTGSMNALAGKHGSVLRRACMQGNDRLF